MSRSTFSTGLFPHQGKVVLWVRKRLAQSGNAGFQTGRGPIDQNGVILADGVGLGKTWEALAGAALILVERSKDRFSGGRRRNLRRQPAHVLVLCPPGLVSKWTR